MAIWQYGMYLVPGSAIAEDGTLSGLSVTDESFGLPSLDFGVSADAVNSILDGYLPRQAFLASWCQAWGEGDKDDAGVTYRDDGNVKTIRLRLDLRDLTIERVRRLLALANALKCRLRDERTLEVFPATEEALLAAIRKSRPARFVHDPRGFIEGLSGEQGQATDE